MSSRGGRPPISSRNPMAAPSTSPWNGSILLSDQVASWGNWRRFYLSDEEAPDTVVKPLFWHERNGTEGYQNTGAADRSFGQNLLIPLPSKAEADAGSEVFAQFDVSALAPPGVGTANLKIYWEFLEDGVLADYGIVNAATDTFISPRVSVATPPPWPVEPGSGVLGDLVNRTRAISYVFRATAFYHTGPLPAEGKPDGLDLKDQTPANVYFVVVPTDVGKFVNPPMDPNAQPFKEQEIQVR